MTVFEKKIMALFFIHENQSTNQGRIIDYFNNDLGAPIVQPSMSFLLDSLIRDGLISKTGSKLNRAYKTTEKFDLIFSVLKNV